MPYNAVFLDRDGVINDNFKSVNQPQDLVLFPWAAQSIRRLKKAGYLVFVVTNQGGIELGYISHEDLSKIHQQLQDLLQTENAHIDEIIYCHHFNQECECRKPKPGMILTLVKKYNINRHLSWMIGDRESDILAGKEAECQTIKIGEPSRIADYNCDNLSQAVDYILKL